MIAMSAPTNAARASHGLALLLAAPVGSGSGAVAAGLVESATRRGIDVDLFLMDAGVDALGTELVPGWIAAGARVTVCTRSAADRRAPLDIEGVDYAGQYQLAALVAGAPRFVGLTR